MYFVPKLGFNEDKIKIKVILILVKFYCYFYSKKLVIEKQKQLGKSMFNPIREKIARRAALEFNNGMYANLGI